MSLKTYFYGLNNSYVISSAKRREIFIILLCLLVGFVLRFYTFDQKSLWLDEVYTFNDSRDDLKGQIKFYKENPSFIHPPLFFILTHQFYPFTKPERDLRIIPLIFGTLSIPMIYLLAAQFSPSIALPCTLSLTFMVYHISLSQDGRSYSLLMFLGMTGLCCFLKHLQTSNKRYLLLAALFFSILFYTSYSSILFIVLSQILWFYRPGEEAKKPNPSSFFILNGLTLLLCLPWILFVALNYKGQSIIDPLQAQAPISFQGILYGILHDWVLHGPLMVTSVILLIILPIFSKFRKNAFILIGILILPIGGLYLFCKLLDITHFVTSRYLINFLPLFFVTLFLSLDAIEVKFEGLQRFVRLRVLFLIIFIASNLVILPLYYRSEKQDFRDLATYLKANLNEGDKIFLAGTFFFPGVLHYFGIYPVDRHYRIPLYKVSDGKPELRISLFDESKEITIFSCDQCIQKYMAQGGRLWIVAGGKGGADMRNKSPFTLKGYFDGSFCNFDRFPTDASIYLFLWDPKSPDEKGIDMSIE